MACSLRQTKRMDKEEQEVAMRLTKARVVHWVEPFLAYFDDHKHLQNPMHQNKIIQQGWAQVSQEDDLFKASKPPCHIEGPPTSKASLSLDVLPPPSTTSQTQRVLMRWQRTRCKYCQVKAHFNKECEDPYHACHALG